MLPRRHFRTNLLPSGVYLLWDRLLRPNLFLLQRKLLPGRNPLLRDWFLLSELKLPSAQKRSRVWEVHLFDCASGKVTSSEIRNHILFGFSSSHEIPSSMDEQR